MSNNFNLFFYLKEPKRYKSGPVPVYLRITIDCQRVEIAVGRDIDPAFWDLEKRRAKGTKELARQLNHHMDTIQSKIKEVHTQMIATGDEITARNLKDNYLGINAQSRMLLEIFREHNAEMESLIGNGFSDNTLRTFKSSLKHIMEYLQVKYKVSDISIRKVDQAFIKNYDTFLRTKHHKCTPISADKYVKHLKKIILLSLGNRWITENPFMHYKSTAKPTPRTFLTNDELIIIIKKEFAVERLKQVRDIFIFCCYTGLAYVDVQKLKPTEIGVGDDGKQWIFTSRHKTNTPVHLPLLPEAALIIHQYKHHPVSVAKSKVLPVFTNQRMNSYLIITANIGIYAIPEVKQIVSYQAQIIKLVQKNPAIAFLGYRTEIGFVEKAQGLIGYVTGLTLSIGDVNQMKSSDRKLLFDYVLMQLSEIQELSGNLVNTLTYSNLNTLLRSINPFQNYIDQDKNVAESIIQNAKFLRQ